jgi:hypothetical protein
MPLMSASSFPSLPFNKNEAFISVGSSFFQQRPDVGNGVGYIDLAQMKNHDLCSQIVGML